MFNLEVEHSTLLLQCATNAFTHSSIPARPYTTLQHYLTLVKHMLIISATLGKHMPCTSATLGKHMPCTSATLGKHMPFISATLGTHRKGSIREDIDRIVKSARFSI